MHGAVLDDVERGAHREDRAVVLHACDAPQRERAAVAYPVDDVADGDLWPSWAKEIGVERVHAELGVDSVDGADECLTSDQAAERALQCCVGRAAQEAVRTHLGDREHFLNGLPCASFHAAARTVPGGAVRPRTGRALPNAREYG